jgi:predicted ATPase/DNA-binding XRE family transcriptional regulator
MTTLADLVRQYRSDARLSQEGLAERAGVSTRTVSDIECGLTRSPRAITISLLVQALQLADDDTERLRATIRRNPGPAVAEFTPFRLPPETLPLLGRDADIASAAALLVRDDVRLVTFLGGPGVGKTSLALAAAQRAAGAFDGGALLVELAAVPDSSFVPTKIAFAAQIRDARDQTTALAIAAALRGRRTLLVLDTCEHVAAAAPFLAEMLSAATGLTIAATSRVPLRIAAETEFAVDALAVPAGGDVSLEALAANPTVALLVERVRQRDPQFALTPRNAAAVAELARLTEGIPLAVTLAAPLVASSSAANLVGRFDRRLPLLVTGDADLPPRQRTMRDAVAWSYELLAEHERRVFRRLSVCRGSFSAEAAHAVAGDPGAELLDTLRVVAVLVDQNLLAVSDADDGEPRFAALEIVREFGAELLAASGEAEAAYRHLARYAAELAAAFGSALPAARARVMFDRIARETATFDVVLEWSRQNGEAEAGLRVAVALWNFWWYAGAFAQGTAWLEALLAVAKGGSPVPDDVLGLAYMAAAGLAEARGGYRDGEGFARKALPLRRKVGDLPGVASLLCGMGVAASERGEYARAHELMSEGLAIRQSLGDELATGKALFDLGKNAANGGDPVAARSFIDRALSCFRNVESSLGIAFVFAQLGLVAAREGSSERAETFSREALRMGESVGHQTVIAQAKQNLAFVALQRGAHDEAERAFRAVLRDLYATDSGPAATEALEGLAAVRLARGDPAEAARLLGAAHGWRERSGLHVYPAIAGTRAQLVKTVKDALGESRFDEQFRAGADARGVAESATIEVSAAP